MTPDSNYASTFETLNLGEKSSKTSEKPSPTATVPLYSCPRVLFIVNGVKRSLKNAVKTRKQERSAFLILVIMMQKVKMLVDVPGCIANYINRDTYLEKDDPDLIKKISKCLTRIKQGKGNEKKVAEQEEVEIEEMI